MALVRSLHPEDQHRGAGQVYGFSDSPQIGAPCTTAAGQQGTIHEWYDPDMGMVIGAICTTDPPGVRVNRYNTSPTSSYSNPTPIVPQTPAPSPFAAGRVPGGACEINGVRGVFITNAHGDLECSVNSGPQGPMASSPATTPIVPPPPPLAVGPFTSSDPAPVLYDQGGGGGGGGGGLTMPDGGGGGGGAAAQGGGGSELATALGVGAALLTLFAFMRKR